MPTSSAEQLTWAAIAEPRTVPFTGLSYGQVKEALEATFGAMPIRLDRQNLAHLRAMKHAVGQASAAAYEELFNAIDQHGAIEVRDA